jgi:hypothetical protein
VEFFRPRDCGLAKYPGFRPATFGFAQLPL